jgi:hypothetical protein
MLIPRDKCTTEQHTWCERIGEAADQDLRHPPRYFVIAGTNCRFASAADLPKRWCLWRNLIVVRHSTKHRRK